MKLELIVLGLLAEKPAKINKIAEIADFIMLRRWFSYTDFELIGTVERLIEDGMIEASDLEVDIERRILSVTDKGRRYYIERVSNFLVCSDADIQMLIIFMLFSSHLPRVEVVSGLEEKLKIIDKAIEVIEGAQGKVPEGASAIQTFSLEAAYRYKQTEKSILKEFLEWAKEKKTWTEFLALDDMWQFKF